MIEASELFVQQNISKLGNVAALDQRINSTNFENQVQGFKDQWKPYNPKKNNCGRFGLSLTSLDGGMSGVPDLDSVLEFNKMNNTHYSEADFCEKTEAYQKLQSLHPTLNAFEKLGRSHLIRFDSGGFFPPHRDPIPLRGACFRVLTLLSNCEECDFVLLLDGRQERLEAWRSYYVNTTLPHSVFAFTSGATILVMNVPYTLHNYESLYYNLSIR